MRIALIQTCAVGDIIIALPIAQYFVSQGHEVVWPIDDIYFGFFAAVAPEVAFMPVSRAKTGVGTLAYFITFPMQIAEHFGCERTYVLYSNLNPIELQNRNLAASLKFDEYKYAVAGVPFARKWDLTVVRSAEREQELLERLGLSLSEKYVVVQESSGDGSLRVAIQIPQEVEAICRVVHIQMLTKSLADWIPIFENAQELFLIDSAPANLVEQLRIKTKKTLYFRSPMSHTPIFAQGWTFK
jgi:hypothetical protein